MTENQTFEIGDAGSSDTTPCQAGSIKKGGYCMLKGFPCKVTEYSTAKPGKHGSSKATIVGNDIFTNKRYQDTCPTAATVRVPNVAKIQYEVADIDDDDFVTLILPDGSLKQDLKLPIQDLQICAELRKIWDERGQKTVFYSVTAACQKQKITGGKAKE